MVLLVWYLYLKASFKHIFKEINKKSKEAYSVTSLYNLSVRTYIKVIFWPEQTINSWRFGTSANSILLVGDVDNYILESENDENIGDLM